MFHLFDSNKTATRSNPNTKPMFKSSDPEFGKSSIWMPHFSVSSEIELRDSKIIICDIFSNVNKFAVKWNFYFISCPKLTRNLIRRITNQIT